MIQEKQNKWRWLVKLGAVAGAAIAFAAVLFVVLPVFMDRRDKTEFVSVDPESWTPAGLIELCPPDSLEKVLGSEDASLFVRYDASAPEQMPLVVNRVEKDGSETRDTVVIALMDRYRRPLGRDGYMMSEIVVPVRMFGGYDGCRSMEIFPADTICGIHHIGLVSAGYNDNRQQQ